MGQVVDMRKDAPPRVRLAKDIDLSMAKPGCKHCGGPPKKPGDRGGIVGFKVIDVPDANGKIIKQEVPIICRCVTRRGGVKPDLLDEFMRKTKQQLDDGTFADNMARDIDALPEPAREAAIRQLAKDADNQLKDSKVRQALREALGKIEQIRAGKIKNILGNAMPIDQTETKEEKST